MKLATLTDSWRVWRRALAASPAHAIALGVLVLLNAAGLILSSTFVSQAASVAASGRDGGALVRPLVSLIVTLVATALAGALLTPVCLRLQRAVVLHQVNEVVGTLARLESSAGATGVADTAATAAERVVSVPHREALGAVTGLLRIRCRGLAGVVVLGLISPIAAVVLAVCVISYGRAFTDFLDDVLSGLASRGPLATRRARYLRSLQFNHSVAGELRVFGALPWLLRSFSVLSEAGRVEAFAERQRHAKTVALRCLLCTAGLLGCFAWLMSQAWNGHLDIERFTFAVQGALLMLDLGPAGDVAVRFRQTAQVERDLQPSDATMPTTDVPVARASDGESAVVCRSIRHVYPGSDHAALDITELRIRRGERVAVVGPNGAGKSTLFGIIAGSLRPTHGTIDVEPAGVSIALQRAVRYPATLRHNISLGNSGVDVDRAVAIVGGLAQRDGEQRSDDLLGTPGANLSGGQWQRVSLARAFGHVTDGVLLLDEPSAALDPATEAEFFRTALDQAHDRTVLLSTHHLANVRFVDRIVVLDGGRIVQEGTHADLMRQGGLYADMFTTQARSYGVEL